MFITSSGFSLNFHYCGDSLKSWSVFGKAEVCDHEKEEIHEENLQDDNCCNVNETKTCCSTSNTENIHENCCSSNSKEFSLNEDYEIQPLDVEAIIPLLIKKSFFLKSNLVLSLNVFSFEFIKHPPPLLNKSDLSVIQCFLL